MLAKTISESNQKVKGEGEQSPSVDAISSLAGFDMWRAQVVCGLDPKVNTYILCPNPDHTEKTASCQIQTWRFRCWGACGTSGDPIRFVQMVQGFGSRDETIVWICQQEQIPIPDAGEFKAQHEAIERKKQGLEMFWGWSQRYAETAYTILEKRKISKMG